MIKKLLFVLITILTINTNAQNLGFGDSPFGLGGGFTGQWIMPDVDWLNTSLSGFGTPELAKSGFFASGGTGFIYVGFIKNLRIGGIGLGGTTSEKVTLSGVNREAVYSYSMGGLTIEYTLPFIRNWGVSVGAVLGGGSASVELYRYDNSPVFWDNILNDIKNPAASVNNYGRKMTTSFWVVTPTLNIDVPLHPLVSVRLGGGYTLPLNKGNWELDNGQVISNMPSDSKNNAFYVQLGIIAGLIFY